MNLFPFGKAALSILVLTMLSGLWLIAQPAHMVDDVIDMGGQVDAARHLTGPLGQPAQGRRGDPMASGFKQPRRPRPAPAAMPCAMDQNKMGHRVALKTIAATSGGAPWTFRPIGIFALIPHSVV